MPIGNFCRYSVFIRKRKVLVSGKSRASFNRRHSRIFRKFKTRENAAGDERCRLWMDTI
jgi:hypothetical protein